MIRQKAIIIGAGIGGIATAIRLAVKGYQVAVFEANGYAGGKLSAFELDGYRFDAGPSLFTMPQYVDELFILAGKNPRDYFNYRKADPVCKYFYADGTQLSAYADVAQFASEVNKQTNDNEASVKAFAGYSRGIYDITSHVFLERSLHRIGTYLRKETLQSILKLLKIDAFRTMHLANLSRFKDQRMVQFFDRYATYNGSNPYKAPATLNVIPHFEQHYGAWFPEGGMYAITQSLVNLAKELGVIFHYNSPVQEILIEGKRTKGVKIKDGTIEADLVISNMDVWFTYQKLLKDHLKLHPTNILQQERSSSALIFYWGIKRTFNELDLHNIFFSAGYEAEFSRIWQDKTIGNDPTVYLNVSSKYKKDDAPEGHENWFVMINVPANVGQDWEQLILEARANILEKLSRVLNQDIESLITCEQILDPRGIESKTSSYQGSLYGTSSNNRFAAFLRHANRSSKVKNLFFCGGSVHPGGGIPLALLSAKIVADWVK